MIEKDGSDLSQREESVEQKIRHPGTTHFRNHSANHASSTSPAANRHIAR